MARDVALYVNFQENPAQIRRAMANLGTDPDSAFGSGFGLLYASPVELQIDSIVVEIFEAIKTGGVRRVVIDAVGDLASAANDIALGWNVAKPGHRTIRVVKMRSSTHDSEMREFEIGAHGARIT